MQTEKQRVRRQQIQAAALELLAEKGYKATSMLGIAKHAKASNETLYAWYGNKQNLFETLIRENATQVIAELNRSLASDSDFRRSLQRVGELLLELVTGERAVILSRAAAADTAETGKLGAALADKGRGEVVPLLDTRFQQARDQGAIRFHVEDEIVELYLSLLLGDTQIRRTTGAMAPLSKSEIKKRSSRALEMIMRLFGD